MSRLRIAASVVLTALAVLATPALAHKGNPDFESTITARTGLPAGVEVEIVNRDDSLQLVNRSRQQIVVLGYESEPYARIGADGTVEVNRNSSAFYLNEDRFGKVPVPDAITADSPPRWQELNKSGRFQWHDHRIHWMASGRPPQVKDPEVRTKVFDWKVAMLVAGKPALVRGELAWTPRDDGGAPIGAIIGFVGLLAAAGVLVGVVQRRRKVGADASISAAAPKESW